MSVVVALDHNGDGFICAGAQAGDALNLLPNPLLHEPMDFDDDGLQSVETLWLETAYGQRLLQMTFDQPAGGYLVYPYDYFNSRPAAPVQPSTTYTAGVWLRLPFAVSHNVTFAVLDTGENVLASTTVTLTGAWSRPMLTFTTGAADAYVAFRISVSTVTGSIAIDAAGAMLVAGTSLPEGFNTGDARDLLDIITDDVLKVSWRLGLDAPYERAAGATRGTLLLDNASGDYTPGSSAAAMTPGSLVRVYDTAATLDKVLFTGWVWQVEPGAGDLRAPHVSVMLVGPEYVLAQVHALIDLKVNALPSSALNRIFEEEPLQRFYPYVEAGDTHFPFIGDSWSEGIPALRAVQQITEAEQGRFFSDRLGYIHFHGRSHDYGASSASFADDYDDLVYQYGRHLVNHVRVVVNPRRIGSSSIVWRLGSAQLIPAGECRTFIASFRDSSTGRTGATSVITPVPTTDFSANTASDGSGTDVTANITVDLGVEQANVRGSGAILTVCNSGAVDAYVLAGMQLRGTPLIQEGRLVIDRRDEGSIARYGPHLLTVNLPQFVTLEAAYTLADSVLAARAEPTGSVASITLSQRNRLADALTYSLFDRITITDSNTDHSGDYLIITESHEIDLGGTRHRVTWGLEPL